MLAVTGTQVFAGFVNATSLTMPVTIPAAVVTASDSNVVGLMFDNSSTTKAWQCVGIKDTVTSTTPASSVSGSLALVKLRVNVDSTGNATCYINNSVVGRVPNAVSNTAMLSAIVAHQRTDSTSNTVNVDYVQAVQKR
jgi:hypothetical protein